MTGEKPPCADVSLGLFLERGLHLTYLTFVYNRNHSGILPPSEQGIILTYTVLSSRPHTEHQLRKTTTNGGLMLILNKGHSRRSSMELFTVFSKRLCDVCCITYHLNYNSLWLFMLIFKIVWPKMCNQHIKWWATFLNDRYYNHLSVLLFQKEIFHIGNSQHQQGHEFSLHNFSPWTHALTVCFQCHTPLTIPNIQVQVKLSCKRSTDITYQEEACYIKSIQYVQYYGLYLLQNTFR